MAAAAAMFVLTNACAARPLAPRADPALKPNQPNHRRPVPSMLSGSECGRRRVAAAGRGASRARGRAPRATTPELMCTTVPPAKSSSAPRRNSQPAGEKTQCATGVYTTINQIPRNQNHAENFMRSTMAPVISAGVMIANMSWNTENDSGGIGRR